MAGGEENETEGSAGEPLPPPDEPPQPRPGPPHREDEQKEKGEEEEPERSEVQPRAPQIFGEGCALEWELLFPPSVWMWGKEGRHLSFLPFVGLLPSLWCPGSSWILPLFLSQEKNNFEDCQS